jgi:hypothetical protein
VVTIGTLTLIYGPGFDLRLCLRGEAADIDALSADVRNGDHRTLPAAGEAVEEALVKASLSAKSPRAHDRGIGWFARRPPLVRNLPERQRPQMSLKPRKVEGLRLAASFASTLVRRMAADLGQTRFVGLSDRANSSNRFCIASQKRRACVSRSKPTTKARNYSGTRPVIKAMGSVSVR